MDFLVLALDWLVFVWPYVLLRLSYVVAALCLACCAALSCLVVSSLAGLVLSCLVSSRLA